MTLYYGKKFFFWGIFTSEKTIERRLGQKPKSMEKHKLGEIRGVIADFSHLTDDEFYIILGKLALIEASYNLRLCYINPTIKGKREYANIYVPSDEDNRFLKDSNYLIL